MIPTHSELAADFGAIMHGHPALSCFMLAIEDAEDRGVDLADLRNAVDCCDESEAVAIAAAILEGGQ